MKKYLFVVSVVLILSCSKNIKGDYSVKSVSAMKNVMWKGELSAKINFDTILPQKWLYGVGPIEGLTGEITIIDGIPYISTIDKNNKLKVDINSHIGAPFFVYAVSDEFKNINLPSTVTDLKKLNSYLSEYHNSDSAYLFKLKGKVEFAKIHVQNLKPNTKVSSPKEAHQGQVNIELNSISVEIIGFYSNSGHGIYTHHDTNIHTHLLSMDKNYMGHCDELKFNPDRVKLYIASN